MYCKWHGRSITEARFKYHCCWETRRDNFSNLVFSVELKDLNGALGSIISPLKPVHFLKPRGGTLQNKFILIDKCEVQKKVSALTLAAGAAMLVLKAGLMPETDPLSSSSPSSSNMRATL